MPNAPYNYLAPLKEVTYYRAICPPNLIIHWFLTCCFSCFQGPLAPSMRAVLQLLPWLWSCAHPRKLITCWAVPCTGLSLAYFTNKVEAKFTTSGNWTRPMIFCLSLMALIVGKTHPPWLKLQWLQLYSPTKGFQPYSKVPVFILVDIYNSFVK